MEIGPILRAMSRNKIRFGLLLLEVALTLAVVANCVSLILDARRQMAHPSGFVDDDLIAVTSVPFAPAFKESAYLDESVRQDVRTLRAIPGVVGVTNTRFLPWQGGGSSGEVRPLGSKGGMFRTQMYPADDGTFQTLGTKLVEGRAFSREQVEEDSRRLTQLFASARPMGENGRPKEPFLQEVVVSRSFGKLLFGEGPVLGKMLEDTDGDTYRIVGVVDPFYNPYGWPIHEYVMFFATWSRSYEGGSSYLVRCEPGQRDAVRSALQGALLKVNDGRNLRIRTLGEVKALYFAGKSVVVTLMTVVIALLVLVTSLGVVGLTAFSVAERTRQIGTRRALGARRHEILRYFLVENLLVTSLGLTAGIVLAYALNMGLSRVTDVARMDWRLLLGGAFLLGLAGLASTFAPALRGTRVSPAVATRSL